MMSSVQLRYGPPFYVAVFKVNKWSPKPPKGLRLLPAAPF